MVPEDQAEVGGASLEVRNNDEGSVALLPGESSFKPRMNNPSFNNTYEPARF